MDYNKDKYEDSLGREMPNRFEPKKDIIERRNGRLESFFKKLSNHIRLIGDPENPAIIVDNTICLSAYVRNFDLNFTDQPEKAAIISTYKLKLGSCITQEEFDGYLNDYSHRRVYKVHLKNTPLFLSGYNFLDRKHSKGRYPVFAKYNYKLYFNKEYAETIVEDYKDYNLILI